MTANTQSGKTVTQIKAGQKGTAAIFGVSAGFGVWAFAAWLGARWWIGLPLGVAAGFMTYWLIREADVVYDELMAKEPPPSKPLPGPAGFDEAGLRARLEAKWGEPEPEFSWENVMEPIVTIGMSIFFTALVSPLFFTMQTKVSTIVGWILTIGIGLGLAIIALMATGEANTRADRRRVVTDRIDAEVETARQVALQWENQRRKWTAQQAALNAGPTVYVADGLHDGVSVELRPTPDEVRRTRENLEQAAHRAIDAKCGTDEAFEQRVKADAARVIDALKAGQPADLKAFDVRVDVALPAELREAVGGTVVKERQGRRESIVLYAQWDVDKAKRERAAMEQAAAEKALKEKLSKPIPLTGSDIGVVFGTNVANGKDVALDVRRIPHLLVVGTTGFGKSVFLHQLISQLVKRPEAGELYLVDMKGGLEFLQYRSHPKVRVVGQYEDVQATVSHLLQVMKERTAQMVAEGVRSWRGEQIFFIVDEYAQFQLMRPATKAEKEAKERLLADLNKVAMLGRAPGITVVAAIQKPTTDVMDSSFRTNLAGQVCFRVPSRAMASTMFPDLDDLPADPVTLPKGRCLFYNPNTGTTRELQVHVAPEAAG